MLHHFKISFENLVHSRYYAATTMLWRIRVARPIPPSTADVVGTVRRQTVSGAKQFRSGFPANWGWRAAEILDFQPGPLYQFCISITKPAGNPVLCTKRYFFCQFPLRIERRKCFNCLLSHLIGQALSHQSWDGRVLNSPL